MAVMTGLSGNEIYCLHLKNLSPGELVIGNSVFSMGLFGSLAAAGRGFLGGEVPQITSVIHEGRLMAFQRMAAEANQRGGVGITGVTSCEPSTATPSSSPSPPPSTPNHPPAPR